MDEAAKERGQLPVRERVALDHAIAKLETYGPNLPFPHQSDVRGSSGIRELRPRAGRSAWRALYQRIGDIFVIASVGPEAQTNSEGFRRMVRLATKRLEELRHERE